MSGPNYLPLTSIEKARLLDRIKLKIPYAKVSKEVMKDVNEKRKSKAGRSSQGTS